MKKNLVLTILILNGLVVLPIRAMDTAPAVTVSMAYDTRIPLNTLFWATRQASRTFSKIGVPVQFRFGPKAQTVGQSGLELQMYVGMQAPAQAHSNALGMSQPYRQDGRIEVFYSRIQNDTTPELCRSALLAYVMAHEIAHALEGINRHAPTGVLKAAWSFEDLRKIRVATLEFDTSDVELIRKGIEKRLNGAGIAQVNSVSRIVR